MGGSYLHKKNHCRRFWGIYGIRLLVYFTLSIRTNELTYAHLENK